MELGGLCPIWHLSERRWSFITYRFKMPHLIVLCMDTKAGLEGSDSVATAMTRGCSPLPVPPWDRRAMSPLWSPSAPSPPALHCRLVDDVIYNYTNVLDFIAPGPNLKRVVCDGRDYSVPQNRNRYQR